MIGVFGGSGMLGSVLVEHLSSLSYPHFFTFCSQNLRRGEGVELCLAGMSEDEMRDSIVRLVRHKEPSLLVNCLGLVKQRADADNFEIAIKVNAIFPGILAEVASNFGIKLVHISSDCVFSGLVGLYAEGSWCDPIDVYGVSKRLGELEVMRRDGIVIRTSIVGREIGRKLGLFEWILKQKGSINGYEDVFFSGVSTEALAAFIIRYSARMEAGELYHFASERISKASWLRMIVNDLGLNVEVVGVDVGFCDRSLSTRVSSKKLNFVPPTWAEMVRDML